MFLKRICPFKYYRDFLNSNFVLVYSTIGVESNSIIWRLMVLPSQLSHKCILRWKFRGIFYRIKKIHSGCNFIWTILIIILELIINSDCISKGLLKPVESISEGLLKPVDCISKGLLKPVECISKGLLKPVECVSKGLLKPVEHYCRALQWS